MYSQELEKNYIEFLECNNIERMPFEKAREIIAEEYAKAFSKSNGVLFSDFHKYYFPLPHPQTK